MKTDYREKSKNPWKNVISKVKKDEDEERNASQCQRLQKGLL